MPYSGRKLLFATEPLTTLDFAEARLHRRRPVWAVGVWTSCAHGQFERATSLSKPGTAIEPELLFLERADHRRKPLFDVANGFCGCIAGINEVLHIQGLLQGRWCLDAKQDLSRKMKEIDRVCRPSILTCRTIGFVQKHLDSWVR
jgi:hypothetical protein